MLPATNGHKTRLGNYHLIRLQLCFERRRLNEKAYTLIESQTVVS